MQMSDYLKKIEAVGYAFLVNLFLTILFYFFICQIPFQIHDVIILIWIWVIYCGFIHILFFLTSEENISIGSKIFQGVVGVILGSTLVISFHTIAWDFHIADFKTKIELCISILVAIEAPFLICYLSKKI